MLDSPSVPVPGSPATSERLLSAQGDNMTLVLQGETPPLAGPVSLPLVIVRVSATPTTITSTSSAAVVKETTISHITRPTHPIGTLPLGDPPFHTIPHPHHPPQPPHPLPPTLLIVIPASGPIAVVSGIIRGTNTQPLTQTRTQTQTQTPTQPQPQPQPLPVFTRSRRPPPVVPSTTPVSKLPPSSQTLPPTPWLPSSCHPTSPWPPTPSACYPMTLFLTCP